MKKIGNRPIIEADTDFSKLQKNKNKNKKIKNFRKIFRKIYGKFSGFFFPFFYYSHIYFLTKRYVITFPTSTTCCVDKGSKTLRSMKTAKIAWPKV